MRGNAFYFLQFYVIHSELPAKNTRSTRTMSRPSRDLAPVDYAGQDEDAVQPVKKQKTDDSFSGPRLWQRFIDEEASRHHCRFLRWQP